MKRLIIGMSGSSGVIYGIRLLEILRTVDDVETAVKFLFPGTKSQFEPSLFLAGTTNNKTIIICGIEAHVCVLQTVVDLLAAGYTAVVVEDCISSRNPEDKRVAVERMRTEGAVITTCESILFELARVAGTDEFKAISRLVK